MKKIVITGGLGHIGSSLIHDYRIQGYKVVVIDNLLTHRYCSLFNLKHPVQFIEADITDDEFDFDAVMKGAYAVVHLAALVNAGETIDKEGETESVNFEGTRRIVESAQACGVEKFIHMSTTSVYGPSEAPLDEELQSEYTGYTNPQTPYASTKLRSEDLVTDGFGGQHFILRAGTIFGISPGVRFHTVTNKFIWQAITGQPITIWEPGTGSRPYASLEHLKDAIFTLLGRPVQTSGIYNIVSHHWSPEDLRQIIAEYIPDLEVIYVTPRILNQDSYLIDGARALRAHLYMTSEDIATEQLEDYIVKLSKYVLAGVTHA